MQWSMSKHSCKTCGYKGDDKHTDIYDCCDYVDPTWMYDWLVRMKKRDMKDKVENHRDFVKWCKSVQQ